MKIKLILLMILCCFWICLSQAQLLFGVKPGLVGNSGQFGLKIGGLMAFGGIEFIRTAITTEETGTRVVYHYMNTPPYNSYYQLESYSDKRESTTNIYAPFVGAKILLGGRETGKTGAYITAIICKPLISGKDVSNGVESESTKKFYENLSAWMFMAGFGGEYFLSEDFSIGGEFGIRAFLFGYNEEENEVVPVYDYQTGTTRNYNTTRKYNFDLGLGITYSTLVLNYYL